VAAHSKVAAANPAFHFSRLVHSPALRVAVTQTQAEVVCNSLTAVKTWSQPRVWSRLLRSVHYLRLTFSIRNAEQGHDFSSRYVFCFFGLGKKKVPKGGRKLLLS
jgi:hypothetical protein